MENILLETERMVKSSNSIPEDIKAFVLAICKGYIRHSNAMIPLIGVENVCKTNFIRVEEDDKSFSTVNNIFGLTSRKIMKDGSLENTMYYINANNKIKFVTILLHELGHIISVYKVNEVLENAECPFPFFKDTLCFYGDLKYENDMLMCRLVRGFRINDGFLETICSSIFSDPVFREEIRLAGCDLGDYVYKDKRLFSSRIYDEFRHCFQLFNEIMDGKLFEFACMFKENNNELLKFIINSRIDNLFKFVDKTLESLWCLKKYENKERDENFELLATQYLENKSELLKVADFLTKEDANKEKINILRSIFADMTKFKGTLPFTDKELSYFDENKPLYLN